MVLVAGDPVVAVACPWAGGSERLLFYRRKAKEAEIVESTRARERAVKYESTGVYERAGLHESTEAAKRMNLLAYIQCW